MGLAFGNMFACVLADFGFHYYLTGSVVSVSSSHAFLDPTLAKKEFPLTVVTVRHTLCSVSSCRMLVLDRAAVPSFLTPFWG